MSILANALNFLRTNLNASLPAAHQFSLGNISQTGADEIDNTNVISIVNIEEEATLKNRPNYIKGANNSIQYQTPPIPLNLYVLFASTLNDYEEALKAVSGVIGHFQVNKYFNSGLPAGVDQMSLDLHTLSFEQSNHIWGVMGGKYFPSVIYKLRVIEIQKDIAVAGPVISEAQVNIFKDEEKDAPNELPIETITITEPD